MAQVHYGSIPSKLILPIKDLFYLMLDDVEDETKASKKKKKQDEPSSLFQRFRVDQLLGDLVNKFPPKVLHVSCHDIDLIIFPSLFCNTSALKKFKFVNHFILATTTKFSSWWVFLVFSFFHLIRAELICIYWIDLHKEIWNNNLLHDWILPKSKLQNP